MNMQKLVMWVFAAAVFGLMASRGSMHVLAQGSGDPVGDPVAAPAPQPEQGAGESTQSFAFPKVYVSAPVSGNVAGWGYADEDIMVLNTGNGAWSKAFDGTDAGLAASADIDAVATIINSGYLSFLMSFDKPAAVPGLGTVDDSDVVRYDTFNGDWSMYLDGSTVGLTTNGEDIDALTFSPGGYLVLSTTAGFAVKNMEGGTLKGKDEDLLLLVDKNTGDFTLWLKGSTIGLKGTNNIRGASFMPVNDSVVESARYIVAQAGFTLPNGVSIGAGDLSEQVWYQSGYTDYYKRLDASDSGFAQIDAVEVVK